MLGLLAREHEAHEAVVEVGGVDAPGHPARRALEQGSHRHLRPQGIGSFGHEHPHPPLAQGGVDGWSSPPWW